MHLIYGGFHEILYVSPTKANLAHLKFNPKFPPESQHKRDRFWSTLGCVQSSLHEIGLMYLWANDYIPHYTSFWQYPVWSIAWLIWVTLSLSLSLSISLSLYLFSLLSLSVRLPADSMHYVSGHAVALGAFLLRAQISAHTASVSETTDRRAELSRQQFNTINT